MRWVRPRPRRIPDDNPPSPVPTPLVGTGKRGFPDVRRATGDEELGRRLRAARELVDLTLKEVAAAVGVSPSSVHAYDVERLFDYARKL